MRITVFTSNQPRHLSLIERLASVADEVYAVQECNTVFPGRVPDFFKRSDVMQRYFAKVIDAEREVFGEPRFPAATNVRQLPVKMGDVNLMPLSSFGPALDADVFVVFGATYIKGDLCDHLVARRAVNIHMGVSPYYRGSSTNFWAMYDRRPEYVGATIHLLTKGLDSGPMLFHAFPEPAPVDPFVYGMLSVRAAHHAVVEQLRTGRLLKIDPVPQDRTHELRYTRNADFTDAVAAEYLDRLPTPADLAATLAQSDRSRFLRPAVL
jgi:hypothetical protein